MTPNFFDENGPEFFLADVHFSRPGVVRFESCNPAEVLGQISRGEELTPTCSGCGALLPKEGNAFKVCPVCSGVTV